jgi:hypothetical protein
MLAGILPDDNAVAKSDCATSLQTPDGKVQFTGANKGWSNKPGSPVVACLGKSGSNATLSISNKLSYILEVAATDGVTPKDATDSANDVLVARLSKLLFPDRRVKAYLGRDAELSTTLHTGSLPTTVQLRADPSTFLTEAAMSSLTFLVGLISGESQSKQTKLLDTVLSTPDVIDCVRGTLNIGQGQVPSFGDILNLIGSKCTEKITKVIGENLIGVVDQGLWDGFLRRLAVVGGGIATGWNAFATAMNGITMQFVGTVSVVVDIERPLSIVIRPFVGEWRALRAVMTIRPDGTGQAAWAFPDKTVRTVAGSADIVFSRSATGIRGKYLNVTYQYVGGSTPGGKMPFKSGDVFDLTFKDVSLLQNGQSYWCRTNTPYSFQQMNCQVP